MIYGSFFKISLEKNLKHQKLVSLIIALQFLKVLDFLGKARNILVIQ